MYVREVKGKTLTFCVSGLLWNGSLVMRDIETRSLWSHILGEAMQGALKGAELESIPCDMVTWKAWRSEHPKTTVLDLPRTSIAYSKDFYRRPERFVFGFLIRENPYHCSFATLRKKPLWNLALGDEKLLLSFDPGSTSARLFSRRLDGRVLSFVAHQQGRIRDEQTGSVWSRSTGIALEGPLKGKQLEHGVGIVSYADKWRLFHPSSREITGPS